MIETKGIIPALVTPFNESGEIDEKSLRNLVRHTIKNGCHGVFCLGSNGEFFSLTNKEKIEVAKIVVDEVNGEVPVYAGTGCNSTIETIELTNEMGKIGVSAVSIITPYFVKLSQKELIHHFTEISNAVTLPIILYNIPNLTGNNMAVETVSEISKLHNVIAIKDSSGNFDQILQLIDLSNESFSVLVGTDSLILPGLMSGAKGAIAATANLLPHVVVNIYNEFEKGDFQRAEASQKLLKPLRNSFKLGTMPSVLKEALNLSNIKVGNPRNPVLPLEEANREKLQQVISSYESKNVL